MKNLVDQNAHNAAGGSIQRLFHRMRCALLLREGEHATSGKDQIPVRIRSMVQNCIKVNVPDGVVDDVVPTMLKPLHLKHV